MRKRIKSNLSNDLWLPFWTAVILLFACAVFHSILFYNNFFRAFFKFNEMPIATVTYKYKTAQRKFLARNIWDRLRQNSPVYNGDTIHTGTRSEATVWFNDGNVMDFGENTMAQIFLNDEDGLFAELSGGEILFDTTGSEKGLKLKSGEVQVDIESGSSVSAGVLGETDENSYLQVLKGNAKILSQGTERALTEGQGIGAENGAQNVESGNLPFRLTVLRPTPGQKFLYHEQGDFEVEFNVRAENIPQTNADATLIIATDKNFKNIVNETYIDFSGADSGVFRFALGAKNYYWKIAGSSLSGKFQIVQALPPSLVAPVENYQYACNKKNPAVRFIWSQVANATNYLLEVSADEDFSSPIISQRNSSTSSIISTLGGGKYFWRVTPYFAMNKTGYAAQSQIGVFSIVQEKNVKTPQLLMPPNSGVVNTDSGAVSFSWKRVPEAESYTLFVSENEDLSQPFIDQEVKENYYKVYNISSLAEDGKWYWAVQSQDADGNISPLSEVQTVYGIKGELEQRTIEPANGYKISQNLVADMRFTWKKSLPDFFESHIEISEDAEFKKIIHSQNAAGSSAYVKNLPIGLYYWRLKSVGKKMVLSTPAKRFSVVDNLEAAQITEPTDKLVIRDNSPAQFAWKPVPDADYYKFTIFSADGRTPLHTDVIYESRAAVDMFSDERFLDRAYYRVQVQAFANSVPGVSSRRTGTLSSKGFVLRMLRPIDVAYPREGETLDGKDVLFNPKSAVWNAVDSLSEAQFVLTKTDELEPMEIIRIPSESEFIGGRKIAPNRVLMDTQDGLRPGKYQIIVYAKTLDGIDISNTAPEYKRTFNVSPIPKLPASENVRSIPAAFDADYLSKSGAKKTVTFEWDRVAGASEYRLAIFKGSHLLFKKYLKENKFEIDFMALSEKERAEFSRGNFTCQVEAILRIDTDGDGKLDKIFQEGIPASAKFKTDIPTPKKTTVKGTVKPYGR